MESIDATTITIGDRDEEEDHFSDRNEKEDHFGDRDEEEDRFSDREEEEDRFGDRDEDASDPDDDDIDLDLDSDSSYRETISVPTSSTNGISVVKITQKFIESPDSCTICAICKDEFELRTKVKSLPCKHIYHGCCIQKWLSQNNSCPICRAQLPTVIETVTPNEETRNILLTFFVEMERSVIRFRRLREDPVIRRRR
ncbi:hypothetical protein ZOSMA_2G02400 [Zostera marina]|uniref:RING-type domain-containing protein n=1 Tax=Zostera marina TaxID=29655 RepID=A0A0K9PDE5_ZOSMR|nr:hypothetical protein ZOSMA_2G02400 [Zostera marina]